MSSEPEGDLGASDACAFDGQALVARELRRRRELAGLSLTELARRVGYSRTYISASEKLGADLISKAVVSRIDDELEAGGTLIALHARADAERHARRNRAQADADPAVAGHGSPLRGVSPETALMEGGRQGDHRGEFVSSAQPGAQVAVPTSRSDAGFIAGLGRRDVASRHGFRPTRIVIEEDVDPITRRHRSLYHQMPSADLLPAVLGHLRMVDRMLARADGSIRRTLGSTVAETAGFAAWLYSDLGDGVRMLRLYAIADEAIADSGDRALGGYISGFRAQLLARRGEHFRAIQQAQAARDQAGHSASSIVRAWLAAVHAVALAYAAQADEARRALLEAERHLDSRTDVGVPEWMYGFDHARLSAYTGTCHLSMNEPAEAEHALREALAALPAACGRRRADVRVDLAYALLRNGEVDEAIQLAGTAAEAFGAWESVTGLDRVTSFSTAVSQAGHVGAARSLQEQVLAASTSW